MWEVDNWPRVISLAFEVADAETGDLIQRSHDLVQPDGWDIPKEKFWVEHGFSTEENLKKGLPMAGILDRFLLNFYSDDLVALVAHNLSFDYNCLGAELIRYRKKAPKIVQKICTMESSVNVCKIPWGLERRPWKQRQRGYKWPKLSELYEFLFNAEFIGAHDAGNDVTATRLCFFEMLRLNLIALPQIQRA